MSAIMATHLMMIVSRSASSSISSSK